MHEIDNHTMSPLLFFMLLLAAAYVAGALSAALVLGLLNVWRRDRG